MKKLNIIMSEDVKKNLEKMKSLNDIFETDEFTEGELYEEYRSLLEEMVPVFMPIVEYMIEAGLITTNIEVDEDEEDDMNKYLYISGDPKYVFDNGNIWISGNYSGGAYKNQD